MDLDLEKLVDLDDLVDLLESTPEGFQNGMQLSGEEKSIFQKLHDLYMEECQKATEAEPDSQPEVNLLQKLVYREDLSCLVVTLYPYSEGYTIMYREEDGSRYQAIELPYEEKEFIDYLDAEELPPILGDYLVKKEINLFYSGCVIAEIHDYRGITDGKGPSHDSRHVLLRPIVQTLACDVHSITNYGRQCTQNDKVEPVSQLPLATAQPLCLEPSVAGGCKENKLLSNKKKEDTSPRKLGFKSAYPRVLVPEEELFGPPIKIPWTFPTFPKRKRRVTTHAFDLKISRAGKCVDSWKQRPCNLVVPSKVDVLKYANVVSSSWPDVSQVPPRTVYVAKRDRLIDGAAEYLDHTGKLSVLPSCNNPLMSATAQPQKNEAGQPCVEQSHFHFSLDGYEQWFINCPESTVQSLLYQNQNGSQKEAQCAASVSQPLRKDTEPAQSKSVQSERSKEEAKCAPPHSKPCSSSGTSSAKESSTSEQLPAGPLFLVSPQQRSQVLLQPAAGQPTTLQQPGGQGSAQGSSSQALSQNFLINFSEVQGSVQPLAVVWYPQVGPVQGRPEQSLPQGGVQDHGFFLQLQRGVRQLATALCSVSMADASTQTTEPLCPCYTSGHSTSKRRRLDQPLQNEEP